MAELTGVFPVLVAGIRHEAGAGIRVWLDAGNKPRHENGGRAWRS